MDKQRIQKALESVARNHGVSLQTVIEEIEKAIAISYETAVANGDHAVLAVWRQIPCKGTLPTVWELLAYLGRNPFPGGM